MILMIDNYDSFTYNLYQTAALHGPVKVVRNDKISIGDIQKMKLNGAILSPGPGGPEHAGICLEFIKHFHTKFPILGVCLGLQAIVAALGGHIIQAPVIMHGKAVPIFHQRKNLYQSLPLPFQAGRYHSLIADRASLPSVLEIEAETAESDIMGVKHRDYPLFGVQFHPESILTPDGGLLLQEFFKLCRTY